MTTLLLTTDADAAVAAVRRNLAAPGALKNLMARPFAAPLPEKGIGLLLDSYACRWSVAGEDCDSVPERR